MIKKVLWTVFWISLLIALITASRDIDYAIYSLIAALMSLAGAVLGSLRELKYELREEFQQQIFMSGVEEEEP